MPTSYRDAVSQFVTLVIQQRDDLCTAVCEDAGDAETQRRIRHFGQVPGRFPDGKTTLLLAEFEPRDGFGALAKAFQVANAAVGNAGVGAHFLPMLKAVNDAQRDLYQIVRKAFEESRYQVFGELQEHGQAVCELHEAVGYIASAEAEADAVRVSGANEVAHTTPIRKAEAAVDDGDARILAAVAAIAQQLSNAKKPARRAKTDEAKIKEAKEREREKRQQEEWGDAWLRGRNDGVYLKYADMVTKLGLDLLELRTALGCDQKNRAHVWRESAKEWKERQAARRKLRVKAR